MMCGRNRQIPKPPLSCASWAEIRSGRCGEEVQWELNPETGVLSVFGAGPMEDYESEEDVPWYRGRELVRTIDLEYGVTAVGDRAFKGCCELTVVHMAESVKIIGVASFRGCKKIVKLALSNKLEVISPEAFWDCAELKIVYMPKSIRSIEGGAFGGTNNLKEIFYGGTPREWNRILISKACMHNDCLLGVTLHPTGDTNELGGSRGICEERENSRITDADRYGDILCKVRNVIEHGGDGRLHILVPKLYAERISSKTGDCTFVLFPQGKKMLIDTGVSECSGQAISVLKELGVKEIDYFISTHPHSDHIGGGMAIFNYLYENGGRIYRYYHTGYGNNMVDAALQQALRVKGEEMRSDITAGEQWMIDGVTIDILAPDAERRAFGTGAEEINNISLVMKFVYGQSSYLTAGDLYVRQERWIAQQYGDKLAADVTKASHHGLPTSNCREWIETVSPKIVLAHTDDVGCAKVIQRIYARGAEYYCTGADGMLWVSMDDKANYELKSQYDSVLHHRKF